MGLDAMFALAPRPCKIFVEIGSHVGGASRRALLALPEAKVFSVDPWSNYEGRPDYYGDGDKVFDLWLGKHKEDLGRRIWPIRGFSWDVADCFPFPIDFLLIDGDHSEQAVLRDLRMWVPKVVLGGLVVGDNLEMPSVRKAVERFGHPFKEAYIFPVKPRRPQFWFHKETR